MWGSTSETPPVNSFDDEDLLRSFRNLGLEKDGITSQATTFQCNNINGVGSSSNPSAPTQTRKEGVTDETEFKRRFDKSPMIADVTSSFQCYNASVAQTLKEGVTNERDFKRRFGKSPMIQDVADKPECSPWPSLARDNIWAYYYEGDALDLHSGLGSCMWSVNYANNYNLDYEPNNFSMKTMSSCYGSPSSSAVNHQSNGNSDSASVSLGLGDYMMDYNLMSQNSYANQQFNATTGSYYSGSGYYYYPEVEPDIDNSNSVASCSDHSMNQHQLGDSGDLISQLLLPGNNIVTLAKSESGSRFLQEILRRGNPASTNMILEGVLDSIFELMTDQYGHHLFQRLIEACNGNWLQLIVWKVSMETKSLINAALNPHGSLSIQKLIKQLKKSSLASILTLALSTGLYELMTHDKGRRVIGHCFIHLDNKKNKVLYEQVIKHCIELATHPVGCISLDDCIDFITGSQRDTLLKTLSDHSVHLSHDPSGNYVVQHILGLQNPFFTHKICTTLQGSYTRLSSVKNGSHVVEKCITSSDVGMTCVVLDLLKSHQLLKKLARHQFGNYVIQTALKTTKCANTYLYESLASALRPYFGILEHHKAGQNVVKLIRGF